MELSLKVNACLNFTLEQLEDAVFDRRIEIHECIQQLHKEAHFYNGCYSLYLTKWIKTTQNDDTYWCVIGSFNVNNPDDITMCIQEGYMYNGVITESDAFLDIKVDKTSLSQALVAMTNNTLPLHNRGKIITTS